MKKGFIPFVRHRVLTGDKLYSQQGDILVYLGRFECFSESEGFMIVRKGWSASHATYCYDDIYIDRRTMLQRFIQLFQ